MKNRYLLPLIQETLNRLTRAKYFTKLNIVAAFNKIRMAEGEEWKTAFRTRYGLFESLVMNFGLCGAPSAFQNYINDILHEHLNNFCSAYINDIFIYSKSKKKHAKHIRLIFQKFQKTGLQLDINKYEFYAQKVKYLNLIITPESIKMDQEKIASVLDWPRPENLKNVQSFLGFANFYKRFIKDFSKHTAPLNALTKKNIFFQWGPDQQKAFDDFKIAFTTAPILFHFDFNKQAVVEIDVSDYVTAGIFFQYDDDGQLRPVVYFFCKMNPAECNYEIYDKKLLTIINAFELWKLELEGIEKPVQVVTDHKNLENFISNKLLSRRQTRWSEFLSRFNFEIIYRPGSMNNKADAFTRRSGDVPKKKDNRRQFQWQTVLKKKNLKIQQLILAINDDELSPITGSSFPTPSDSETNDEFSVTINDAIGTVYAEDERTQFFFNALNTGQRTLKRFPLSKASVTDGRIFFRDKLFVPDVGQLKLRLIKKSHDDPAAGHPGKAKTYEILSRYYYWPGIINDVKRFVKNCYGCRKSKNSRDKYHGALKPLPVPDRRWSHISIDFIVDLPVNRDLWGKDCINIMVIIDRLSKMVKCIFMDGITAKDAAKAFYTYIWKNHGLPNSIISDRGRTFVNYFWDQLTTRLGIKTDLSTAYHPETDGQTEILNSIFEQYLKTYVTFLQNDWASLLPSAEFAINNHVSEITQCTSFLINSGQHLKMGLEPDLSSTSPWTSKKKEIRSSLMNSSKK